MIAPMALPSPTSLETVVLRAGRSTAYVAPARGAIVTRFFVDERPVLFLDEATLLDPTKNVRGGNPVLFPSPGKLEPGRFTMGQHGFARNEPWSVVERTEVAVTLRLEANARTRAVFPYDFRLTFTFALRDGALRIDQRFEGEHPFATGFHPYFHVTDKARARIPTKATRAFDNVTKRAIALERIDLAEGEVDLHLFDHDASEARLELDDGVVIVRGSDAFARWVIWTLPERPFVCLEPWSAAANALHTGESLLAPPVDLWTEIAWHAGPKSP